MRNGKRGENHEGEAKTVHKRHSVVNSKVNLPAAGGLHTMNSAEEDTEL